MCVCVRACVRVRVYVCVYFLIACVLFAFVCVGGVLAICECVAHLSPYHVLSAMRPYIFTL